jgi:transposase InsO family protein
MRTPDPGLYFHSDRGSQYSSQAVRTPLKVIGANLSMSAQGNCYDNAKAEAFFSTSARLKQNVSQPNRCLIQSLRRAVKSSNTSKFITIISAFIARWVTRRLGNLKPSITKEKATFSKKKCTRITTLNVLCVQKSETSKQPIN